jgi:uncharacterized protein
MQKDNKLIKNVGFIYLIILTLFVGVRIISSLNVFGNLDENMQDVVYSSIIQIGILGILPITLYTLLNHKKLKETFKDFKYKKVSFKIVCYSILIGILIYILNIAVATLFAFILSLLGYETTSSSSSSVTSLQSLLLTILLSAVFPGIFEETVHRGMLLNTYKKIGVKKALIISALMFGLMHLNINQFFYATILGFVIGILCIVSDSIFPCMIVHFMNNFLSSYLPYAYNNDLFGKGLYSLINEIFNSGNGVLGFIVCVIFLIICFIAVLYLILSIFKEVKGKMIQENVRKSLVESILNGDSNSSDAELLTNANYDTIIEIYKKQKGIKDDFELLDDSVPTINKMQLSDNLFLYTAMILGFVITFMTFIWGTL